MVKNSVKQMLLGISVILLGFVFSSSSKTIYIEVTNIALGLFGFMVVLSGFFARD